jgi:hypothetical protein
MADKNKKPKTHEDLKGFDIKINEFGEITSSYSVDNINHFLNDKVDDKKLKESKDEEE